MKNFNTKTFDVAKFQELQKKIADINDISIQKQKKILYELKSLSRTSSLLGNPSSNVSNVWAGIWMVMLSLYCMFISTRIIESLVGYLIFIASVVGLLFATYLIFREFIRYSRYKKHYKKTYEEYVRFVKKLIENNELILSSVLTLRGEAIRNQLRPIFESEFPDSEFAVETLLDKIYPKKEWNLLRYLWVLPLYRGKIFS
jgi:hypothetical protein